MMIRMCCVCGKVETGEKWRRNTILASERVSHVYCPLCYEILMDEIERFAMQRLSKPVYSSVNIEHLQAA